MEWVYCEVFGGYRRAVDLWFWIGASIMFRHFKQIYRLTDVGCRFKNYFRILCAIDEIWGVITWISFAYWKYRSWDQFQSWNDLIQILHVPLFISAHGSFRRYFYSLKYLFSRSYWLFCSFWTSTRSNQKEVLLQCVAAIPGFVMIACA